MRLLDSSTAALNAREHDEARKDFAHEMAMTEQALSGIDPVKAYRRDILASREDLNDLLADALDSGALADIAYLAIEERRDPANGEAASMLTEILDRLAQKRAEQLSENRGGIYDPTYLNCDMEYQQSLLNLTAYKEQLSR